MTALFVANDHMALGALRALHEQGVRIPDEVSVVGFDNVPESPYFHPPLTTVHQDFSEFGRQAVELLLRQLEGEDLTGTDVLIRPDLVVRASTAPPPS